MCVNKNRCVKTNSFGRAHTKERFYDVEYRSVVIWDTVETEVRQRSDRFSCLMWKEEGGALAKVKTFAKRAALLRNATNQL